MLVVIFHPQRKTLSVLHQQPLNVVAQSILPGMADADVKRERGGGNHRHKRSHRFEKDTVSHLAASNLYLRRGRY